ncbi:hypothetical protein GSI_03539 [Ganoderma sinense ZZ0214-1]|uniref:Lysine-specific metallo-endopeptidase domain-containing protein n=1 Tax=Ganoderma sinense ZZ0214-1 TaxID=1077348 RepID=A0A2G8SJ86_9APHY|nr:hypothetical protein GSI_03539 [Ganoderma sinense ZZ0214-1]
MFSASLRAALVLLAASAPAVSAVPGLSLQVAGPTVVNGVENLQVVATLTNTGDETLKLLKDPNSVLHTMPADTFAIATEDGASPSFVGVRLKYSPIQTSRSTDAAAFVILAPGASVSVTHDLSSSYDFTNTGHRNYTITAASNRFQFLGSNDELSEINATPGPTHTAALSGGLLRRPGLLKRASFNGCSDDQQATLLTAASSAQDYASEAASYLGAHSDGTPRYTTWFGAYDSAHHDTVQSHFDSLNGNSFSDFTYDCTCTDSTVFAYVYPDQFGTVYLCGAFWNAPSTGADSQAGTLVHEATHFTANGGTKDYAYGRENCQALAQSNPDEAVFNADNHEYFAENTPPLE